METVKELQSCKHCSAPVPGHRTDLFCCSGCVAVFNLLQEANLGEYYKIRQTTGTFRKASPVSFLSEKTIASDPFSYLDDSTFRQELGITRENPNTSFYLEGVHCTACMWLIEKLPELLPADVKSARLDLQRSVVKIVFKENGSIAKTADYLDQLGYRPHVILTPEQGAKLENDEARTFLLRLVLAGAMTGNIMIFAISIYAGATGLVKDFFDWIVLALSLPVFLYCAIPIYQNAWNAVKNKRWSVDIPIVIALAAGWLTSVIAVFKGTHQNYLDSLTGLIFLLLSTRFLLMRLQKNAYEGMQFLDSVAPAKVLRNGSEWVWVKQLIIGDQIEIPAGLTIPIDGIVTHGKSRVNEAVLTGESLPRVAQLQDLVFSGTVNLDSPLHLKVVSIGNETRMGQIIKEIQRFDVSQTRSVKLSEKVAKFFTISVLIWSAFVFVMVMLQGDHFANAIQRVLSILIVSCPCAFAIATPLALIQAYQILIKKGLYLKNPASLDYIREIKQIVFDKTGTLTEGNFQIENINWSMKTEFRAGNQSLWSESEVLQGAAALERHSPHPLAKALIRYVDSQFRDCGTNNSSLDLELKNESITDFKEIPGFGVSGIWRGMLIEILTSEGLLTAVEVRLDGTVAATIQFKDQLRSDAKEVVTVFKKQGFDVWILSGDQKEPTLEIARQLGIPENRVQFRLTPETKCLWIEQYPNSLYVGDGANDGLALSKATLGIAAHGALDISLKAAQGYLIQNRLTAIVDLFSVSTETHKILIRHLIFTVFYNGVTIALASSGMLHPLIAAVLMPLSSLVILISTFVGTKKLRRIKAI